MSRLALLRRKLMPPALPAVYVPRPRLLETLASGQGRRATLVTAGPGYGKSTAVKAYLSQRDEPAVWLNLGPAETSREALLRLLVAGASSVGLPVPDDIEPLLASSSQAWASVLESLLDTWAEAPAVIIVLDDVHVLEGSAAQDVLALLVEAMPENCQLIMTSRSEPSGLRLGQWRVRQQIVDIGPLTLRFSAEELASLIEGMTGLSLGGDELGQLVSSTDGWVAGLILAIHAQQGLGGINAQRLIELVKDPETSFAYLAEEVFDRQSEDLRRFMLKSALLPELEPDLCKRALGDGDAVNRIGELQRRHLFVQPLGQGSFEYHPLFRACLLRLGEQQLSNDERQAIATAAGPQLDAGSAITMHLAAGNPSAALNVLRQVADTHLKAGDLTSLMSFLAGFPPAAQSDPWWILLKAEVDRQQGDLPQASERLQSLLGHRDGPIRGRALAQQAAILGATGQPGDREAAEAALQALPPRDAWGRAFALNVLGLHWLHANEADKARETLSAALSAALAADDPLGQSKVLINLGLSATRLGRLQEAETHYQGAIARARAAGRVPQPVIYQNRASVANYRGDHAQAMAYVEEGLSLATALNLRRDIALLRYTRGLTLIALADPTGAGKDLRAALEWAKQAGDRVLAAQCLVGLSDKARASGDRPQAQRFCDEAVATRGLPLDHPAMTDFHFPLSRLALDRQDWPQAATFIDPLVTRMRGHGFAFRLAQALRYQAELRQAQGDTAGAEAADGECRQLSEAEGYRPLLEAQPTADGAATAPEPEVQIRCFGRFDVAIGGRPVTQEAWQGHKTRMILAMLLLEPDGLSRESLTDWLYPDQDVSRSAVLTLINRLRKATNQSQPAWSGGGLVLWRDGRYQLNPAVRMRCDLLEFDQTWQQIQQAEDDEEKATACKTLIGLYQGQLFGEFNRERWVILAGERVQRQWQEAYSFLQTHALAQGSPSTALDLADANLALDPTAEVAHRFKIATLLDLGLHDAARRHYQTMVRCLKDELGIDPSPETAALLSRIGSQG